ncbi:hypothetical protein BHE74_00038446 [Ensete ventricosum]|nr:hypothetical protein BHE74_00038446 [Ensete ventricosum]
MPTRDCALLHCVVVALCSFDTCVANKHRSDVVVAIVGSDGHDSHHNHNTTLVIYVLVGSLEHFRDGHFGLSASDYKKWEGHASLSKWSTWELYEVIGVEEDLIGEIPRCCLYIQGGTLSQARQSEPPRGSRDELRCPLVSLEILHKCLW